MQFETHICDACGEQFIVAREQELQEKLQKHKSSCTVKAGSNKRFNKKRERTRQLQRDRIALYVHDITVDRIHQHNFDKLVSQGMLVNA